MKRGPRPHFRGIGPCLLYPLPITPSCIPYPYGLNNPSRYTDPSGHRVCDYDCQIRYEGADPAYKHYGEGLSCWGPTDCWGIDPNSVVAQALGGDLNAAGDALLPTTWGLRGQGEFVPKIPLSVFGIKIPWSITVGGQLVWNRNNPNVISINMDVAPEIGPAFMPDPFPFGASGTAGPLIGWFSSDAEQITKGESSVMSVTAAGGDGYSAAIIIPPPGTPADTKYGVQPFTIYFGKGYGAGYFSVGTGLSSSLWMLSFDVRDWLR